MSTAIGLCLVKRTFGLNHLKNRCCFPYILAFLCVTGCFPSHAPQDPSVLHDRLIHLILMNQLIFELEDSERITELNNLIAWLRSVLESRPDTRFILDDSQQRIISEKNKDAIQISMFLQNRLLNLQSFFMDNQPTDKQKFDIDHVKRAAAHPETRTRIAELIATDRISVNSETGGIAAIDQKIGCIRFLEIPSELDSISKAVNDVKDDPSQLKALLLRIKPRVPFLETRIDRTVDMIDSHADPNVKQPYIETFLELFNFYMRHTYFIDQSTQYSAIAREGFSGLYLGVFHVHPKDNPPSPEDRFESVFRRNLVIVPTDIGCDLHYLTIDRMNPGNEEIIPIPGPFSDVVVPGGEAS